MKYAISGAKMQKVDQQFIKHIGIPSLVLMERAALGVTRRLFEHYCLKRCLIVVGSGNNGADGLAIARQLMEQGIVPEIYCCGTLEKATEEFKVQYGILKNLGANFIEQLEKKPYTVVVDAIFGVGLKREVTGHYKEVICFLNGLSCPKVSVDLPSGVEATTGNIFGCAIKAHRTITFGFYKQGLFFYPAAEYAGIVELEEAGFHASCLSSVEEEAYVYEREDVERLLPIRKPWGNKGTYGKLLIVAGGDTMAGAAYLSAYAAYQAGCGMVKVCTGERNRQILLTKLPELLLSSFETKEEAIARVREGLSWADVVVFGSGMGRNEITLSLLRLLLEESKCPLVFDADGITMLENEKWRLKEAKCDIIITPHLKEFSVLSSIPMDKIKENLVKTARDFCEEYPIICALKDARTVVTKQAESAYINRSGNSGMATAGSGDVLGGIIGSLLAQGMEPMKAATLGVYIHGLAGDVAKERLGEYSMTAGNIAEHLHDVLGGK
ncbi:MAG TPA: NAD(P)H-hydrate dehydratase [Candidatus Scybalomonas excrementigallinarum]|nr:NAD(P)H-hydrate dehydratase [Candidatus Scybalomonas excrementigallinarum]